MMDIALDIKRDIMQFIVGSDKQSPTPTDITDHPKQTQAATGTGVQKSVGKPADGDITAKTLIASLYKSGKRTNLNAVIKELFEQRPETKTFSSRRLLLYLQGFAKKVGKEIKISDSRIRQLDVWKENEVHRKSGKEQNWDDMSNVADENATDVNSVTYE